MKNLTLVLVSVALCAVAVSAGGGKGKWMEKMKKCNGSDMQNTDDVMAAFKKCKDEMKPTQGGGGDGGEMERRKRSPHGGKGGKGKFMKNQCFNVCKSKKLGIFDDSGNFNEDKAVEYINKAYPEQVRSDITAKYKQCAADNSNNLSMDNDCASYKDINMCMWKGHAEICGMKMGWGGKGKGKEKKPDQSAEE